MGVVTFRLEASEAKAVNAFLKVVDAQKQMERGNDRMNRSGQAAGKTFQSVTADAGKMVAQLAGFGSAVAAFAAVGAQLNREWDHLRRVQAEAAATHVSVGDARANALLNRPPDISLAGLESGVERLTKLGVTRQDIWTNLAGPLSAKGSLSQQSFWQAANIGARIHAATGGLTPMGEVAGGIMDIQRISGVSGRRAFGFIQQVMKQQRVETMGDVIQTVLPGLNAAGAMGFTQEQAAEIGAFATQAVGDRSGKQAATGTLRFFQYLLGGKTQGILPSTSVRGAKRVTEMRKLTKTGMGAIGELQSWYKQASPEDREQFMANLPGRARVKAAFMGLIAGDERSMAILKDVQEKIYAPTDERLDALGEQYFRDVEGGVTEPVRRAKRLFAVGGEKLDLANPAALAGQIRGDVKKILEKAGATELATRFAGAKFDLQSGFGAGDVVGAATKALQEMHQGISTEYTAPPLLYPSRKQAAAMMSSAYPGMRQLGEDEYNRRLDEWRFAHGQANPASRANPDFNPEAARALETMIDELKALRIELSKQRTERQQPPINAHTESAP